VSRRRKAGAALEVRRSGGIALGIIPPGDVQLPTMRARLTPPKSEACPGQWRRRRSVTVHSANSASESSWGSGGAGVSRGASFE
jgi:hypothetical protein